VVALSLALLVAGFLLAAIQTASVIHPPTVTTLPVTPRKDPPVLRFLGRLGLVVLVIATTALALAVYGHAVVPTP